MGDAGNEANFDENVITIKIKEPVELTANFGDLSGLDTVARQPGEARAREEGETQESDSESGKPDQDRRGSHLETAVQPP